MWMNSIWVNKCTCHLWHLMETCVGDLQLSWCIILLDDIIVFTGIPKEHLERLQVVFTKLRWAKLKLKPEKYKFFKREIVYLSHVACQGQSLNGWVQNRGYEEVSCFLYCNRGQVLHGICQLLPSVPEGICLGHPSVVWAGFRRKCKWEKQVGAVDQAVSQGIWQNQGPLLHCPLLGFCRFQAAFYSPLQCQWD